MTNSFFSIKKIFFYFGVMKLKKKCFPSKVKIIIYKMMAS